MCVATSEILIERGTAVTSDQLYKVLEDPSTTMETQQRLYPNILKAAITVFPSNDMTKRETCLIQSTKHVHC